MNLNIYLEDNLGKQITKSASLLGKSRNALIREAIRAWLSKNVEKEWPASVKKFQGISNFPEFESYRDELKEPEDDIF